MSTSRWRSKKLICARPRDGVVIGLPQIDEIGKRWDRDQNPLFCSIGDRTKLRVIVPLSPSDYDLLQENYKKATDTSRWRRPSACKGTTARPGKAASAVMPKSDAKTDPDPAIDQGGRPARR